METLAVLLLGFGFFTLFATGFAKFLLVSLPLSVAWLYWRGLGPVSLMVFLVVFWVVLLLGNGRMTAYSDDDVEKSKAVEWGQVIAGVAASAAILWWAGVWDAGTYFGLFKLILWFVLLAILMTVAASIVGTHIVAPLVVLESARVVTTLASYHAEYVRTTKSGSWYYYARFEGDPTKYRIGWLWFRRFRGNMGMPVSYLRCRCLFGFVYIRNIVRIDREAGEAEAE